jgi:hypothetical protein
MDISIFGSDAEAFRLFLGEEWTPWNMDRTWLRPFDHRFRELRIPSSIWVRRNAQSPWVLDVPLTPEQDGRWTNKKLPGHQAPLEDVTWTQRHSSRCSMSSSGSGCGTPWRRRAPTTPG